MSKFGFTGISYPFRFSSKGGVTVSTTDENDFSHIKESVRQILITYFGERVFEAEFGSAFLKSVFSIQDNETEIGILKFNIKEAVEKWDNRVQVIDSKVYTDDDGNTNVDVEIFVLKYLRSDVVKIEIPINV